MKDTLLVRGGYPLHGTVRISGAKNAGLILMVASILAEGPTTLDNLPRIRDVEVMTQILNFIGVDTRWNEDGSLSLCPPAGVVKNHTSYELAKLMRASNLFLGAMLARQGEAIISLPGGCDIGSRPMDLHLKGMQALGADINIEHGYIFARAVEPRGNRVYLDFPSVGATENIIMMAVKTPGQTVIENAAKEPEIVDLANYLNSMGGKIRGAGTDIIKIDGVKKLKAVRYAIIPDRIEAGTYLAATAAAGGQVFLANILVDHLKPVIAKFEEVGVTILEHRDGLLVIGNKPLSATDIKTLPYPGFPTDMQAQITAVLARARGTSLVTETIFENRFMHIGELNRMNAKIKIDGRSAVIEGVASLTGAQVNASDLRAGAALIIAGLAADGVTEVGNVHHLDRGYHDLVGKLKAVGADIWRE